MILFVRATSILAAVQTTTVSGIANIFYNVNVTGIPEFLESVHKCWTLDFGCWNLVFELWTLDSGLCMLDAAL